MLLDQPAQFYSELVTKLSWCWYDTNGAEAMGVWVILCSQWAKWSTILPHQMQLILKRSRDPCKCSYALYSKKFKVGSLRCNQPGYVIVGMLIGSSECVAKAKWECWLQLCMDHCQHFNKYECWHAAFYGSMSAPRYIGVLTCGSVLVIVSISLNENADMLFFTVQCQPLLVKLECWPLVSSTHLREHTSML